MIVLPLKYNNRAGNRKDQMVRVLIWPLAALVAGLLVNTQAFARGMDWVMSRNLQHRRLSTSQSGRCARLLTAAMSRNA